jgi:hypothetical protein
MRAGFSTPLKPTLRLAWEGITHPRWLFGSFLRTIAQHGMPHFENNYATRGAPILLGPMSCAITPTAATSAGKTSPASASSGRIATSS